MVTPLWMICTRGWLLNQPLFLFCVDFSILLVYNNNCKKQFDVFQGKEEQHEKVPCQNCFQSYC